LPPIKRKTLKKKKREPINITCLTCGETKKETDFYVSSSVFHAGTGRVPYCKSCLKNMSVDKNGNVDVDKLKNVLKEIDKPYIHEVLQSAYREAEKSSNGDVVGIYFKNINSLTQYKDLTWANSIFEYVPEEEHEYELEVDFKVTPEVVARWGNYTTEQYFKLEKFYWDMKTKNRIETPQEEEYLKKLALISMKMDEELEEGNYSQVKQLGELFSKYMADSQFRAIDKTDADKTGGLRTFSQIYAEVEKDDFIPPWEHYCQIKGLTQDIVDKTIMYIQNFILKLNKIESMVEPPSDTPKLEGDS